MPPQIKKPTKKITASIIQLIYTQFEYSEETELKLAIRATKIEFNNNKKKIKRKRKKKI